MITLLLFILSLFLPTIAYAHDTSLTYTTITVTQDQINVIMTTPYKNIIESLSEGGKTIDSIHLNDFSKQFEKGFVIENDGERCNPKLIKTKKVQDIKGIIYDFQFKCKKPVNNLHFYYNLFFQISETHENITDLHIDNFKQEIIFSKIRPVFDLDYNELHNQVNYFHFFVTIVTFLKIGINHILSGYDHILFLLGLLIVTKQFKNLLKVITSFTLAHSITLTIAALGIFLLPSRITESMIALSIAYVAFENIKKRGHIEKRWIIAFIFGLVHGFGFSTALRETGLPKDNLIYSLLSFNSGVELGQLLIIAVLFPVLLFIRKQKWENDGIKILSLIIGIIGFYWFLQRLFFS